MRDEPVDDVVALPSTMDRLGRELVDLADQQTVGGLDETLLTVESIGHAGLAAALQDLAAQIASDAQQLRGHLDTTAAEVRAIGRGYRRVDRSAANQFTQAGDGNT
jgi:uncharacterized protein YukE